MDRATLVRELDGVREALARLLREAPSPAVERLLQDADLYCHTALWLLGETRGLTPEAEGPQPEAGAAAGGLSRAASGD
jgi:hypothetical protein